jgi:hypothetical protein
MSTGTVKDPKFIKGFTADQDGLRMHGEYFVYRCELGLVSGSRLTLKFTLDGSRRQVWPFFKDWNTFMNPHYYTSHAIGDLEEGQTYRATQSPDDLDGDRQYRLDKLLREYVIVQSQPVSKTADIGGDWQIGLGRVPAGSQVVTLDQYEPGKTEIGFFSEHATLMAEPQDADAMSDEEAMAPWHPVVDAAAQLWRDEFVPALRKLVAESAE